MKTALALTLILVMNLSHIAEAHANIETVNVDTESTTATDPSMGEAETNFELDTIDVDGLGQTKTKKERVSMADRMKVMRERMEKRTADIVLRNIEKRRIIKELDMMNKINNAMEVQLNQNLRALE